MGMFNKQNLQLADQAVMMCFAESGWALRGVDSPAFAEMCHAIYKAGPMWKPPSSKRLRTSLLDGVRRQG